MSDIQKEDPQNLANSPPSNFFAPELFQSTDDASLSQEKLASMAMDAEFALEASVQGQINGENVTALMETRENNQDLPLGMVESNPSTVDELAATSLGQDQDIADSAVKDTHEGDSKTKSSKHSSKNEGQHTDRRYLCYICDKLFTRRRSVRDHISKIHNTKTWEPVRSLEIIVEPSTGEPIEPLEVTIARGPPPPPAKRLDKVLALPKHLAKEEIPEPEGPGEHALTEDKNKTDAEVAPETAALPSPATISLKNEAVVVKSRPSSSEPFITPVPLIGKKRPAPSEMLKPVSAAMKKGTAKIKSTPNKKLKISETESISAFRSPSGTPVSSHRTPISKLKHQTSTASSPTPESSRAVSIDPASPSPSASEASYSSNDDGEIFCICRKGDNHTWMIACDGGCDEWFHGNCVNIKERDGDLIDKYVCPNCQREGFQTTWKRMCRRKGCRKPARVLQDPPSKYCSKDCGRMFFVELVRRGDPWIDTMKNGQFIVEAGRQKKLRKKRRKVEKLPKAFPMANGDGDLMNDGSRLATPAYSEDEKSEYETDSSADEDKLPNRGGALRAGEVKALVEQCKTIDQWRDLGQKPVTPPRDIDGTDPNIQYDDFEQRKLEWIKTQMSQLEKQSEMLTAKEKLLDLVKIRSDSITDEVKKANPKSKDPCGFDPRLSWSDEEFLDWLSKAGSTILGSGRIGLPEDLNTSDKSQMVNGINESDSDDEDEKLPTKGGICVKNRCSRHRNWAKGQLAELRFEQDVVRREVARLETQSQEVRDRAVLRNWEVTAV